MNGLNANQLSQYLGITKRSVQRRANREKWPFKEQKGLGGITRMYSFDSLPGTVKPKIAASIVSNHFDALASSVLDTSNQLMDEELPIINSLLQQMAKEVLVVRPDITSAQLRQYFVTFFPKIEVPETRMLDKWLCGGCR